MSTLSIFDAAREAPDRIALLQGSHKHTYAELARGAAPLAAALLAARPQALALTPRADLESLLWLYAAFATGTPLLPLHARSPEAERSALLALSGASGPPVVVPWSGSAPAVPHIADETPFAFVATSGSTGTPRLVELSRAAVLASAEASQRNLGWENDDCWLLCLPLAHLGGLSIVVRCLLARRCVLLFEPGGSGLLARLAELRQAAERATLLSLVPSVLSGLLDVGFSAPVAVRAILLGGAGCSPELAARAHAAHLPLLTSYGLTETASQVVTRPYAERYQPLPVRQGVVSSGKPLPGVSVRLDAERIAIRSGSLFSRYVGEAIAPLDAAGFFATSDRGEWGADGELYVRGRLDDVIISGGENVDPLEVEAAVLSLPAVRAACVFATASEQFGEAVTAMLVSDDVTLELPGRLAELLRDRLARHKLPRRVLLVDHLPLTASGKVDRRECRARFFQRLA